MKKLKLLLLWLFALCWVGFVSAWTLTYNWTLNCSYSNCSSPVFPTSRTINDSDYSMTIDCSFSNFVWDWYFYSSNAHFDYFVSNLTSQAFTFDNSLIITNSWFSVVYSKSSQWLLMRFSPSYYEWEYSFNYSCSFSSDKILSSWTYYLNCPTCDYSEYESQISSLQSNLATATWNLATCQSNLATATWNLATCQSDLASCQNSSSDISCQSTWYISDYIPWNILFSWSKSFSSAWYSNMFNYWDYGAWTYCLKFSSTSPQTLSMWFANGWTTAPTNLYSLYNDQYWNWICLYWNKPYLNVKLNSSSNTIDYEVYKLTDLLDSQFNCPVSSWVGSSCNTWAILSWYILESSINQSYCLNNWLCPSCPTIDEEYCINNFNLISPSSCPVCSGGVSNWSSLWINNIQHLGASNIYMSIPEEISRDYSYSNSWEIMEVDVEGYNVDYDYINNVVEIQKYKPSDEDFNNIVWILAQYMPIIVIFIGLLFLYKLLKKPFKSKL